jgi:radical SAM protein with 4Fe4S-binding SPASM domain
MPYVDNVNVSMDGNSRDIFALNRGGADVDRVWHNVDHFHELRRRCGLARRPRLHFAWTLKRNNVAELPGFVRKIACYEADVLTARHLMVFFPSEAGQSLLLAPSEANVHLREAYRLLEEHGIRRECVPLLAEPPSGDQLVKPVFDAQSVPTRQETVGESEEIPVGGPAARAESQVPAHAVAEVPESQLERAAGLDGCMFVHRMANISYNGEVQTCSVPYSAVTGMVGLTSFDEIWNGRVMRSVRGSLGTDQEWRQCRTCWYREGRYHSQRAMAVEGTRIAADEHGEFSAESLYFISGAKN